MKVHYVNSIPTFVSSEESKIIETIKKEGFVKNLDLNENENYLADQLYVKGILIKSDKNNIITYRIKSQDLDRNII